MRRVHRHLVVIALAAELCAGTALADDPAQQAHAMMREALLERASWTADALMSSRGMPHSPTSIAREHMERMRGAEAERAAHRRAVEHGTRRSGAGRPDREMDGPRGDMHHGGSNGSGSWGMDCQDAAGNSRTSDMHHDWMPGGGGQWIPSGGGTPMGGMLMEGAPPTEQGAAQAPQQRSSR